MPRFTALRRAVATLPRVQARHASTLFRMPAMSPTMTEGGIASWKLSEGQTFSAGDVLLEIETDKATIDVEAQDDGVMGKILVKDGEKGVPVGRVIAVLAEEGDDLSGIEVPGDLGPEGEASVAQEENKEEPVKAEPAKEEKVEPKSEENHQHHKITHSAPLFPSVSRLLTDSNLSPEEIMNLKGTGRNGMLTKGDVLFALGKIKDARGTAGKLEPVTNGAPVKKEGEVKTKETAKPVPQQMDGIAWRRAILAGLEKATKPVLPLSSSTSPITAYETPAHEFDELLEPYSSLFNAPAQPHVELPSVDLLVQEKEQAHSSAAAGGKGAKDEWEGLF